MGSLGGGASSTANELQSPGSSCVAKTNVLKAVKNKYQRNAKQEEQVPKERNGCSEFKAQSLGLEEKTDASALQEITHRLKNDEPRARDSMEANGMSRSLICFQIPTCVLAGRGPVFRTNASSEHHRRAIVGCVAALC